MSEWGSMTGDVLATIEHIRALCTDGLLPSNEEINATEPPITTGVLRRYHGIGRAKLAVLVGAIPVEQREQRIEIVKRIAELGEELGRPPTFPEYMAARNGAPSLHTHWKSEWSKLLAEVFGDFSRRGMSAPENRQMHRALAAPLSAADFERVDSSPPDHLPAKLRWSTDGLMASEAYQDAHGRMVYRLR